jgi:hypothetical protein
MSAGTGRLQDWCVLGSDFLEGKIKGGVRF